jgi:hypothetical protein
LTVGGGNDSPYEAARDSARRPEVDAVGESVKRRRLRLELSARCPGARRPAVRRAGDLERTDGAAALGRLRGGAGWM